MFCLTQMFYSMIHLSQLIRVLWRSQRLLRCLLESRKPIVDFESKSHQGEWRNALEFAFHGGRGTKHPMLDNVLTRDRTTYLLVFILLRAIVLLFVCLVEFSYSTVAILTLEAGMLICPTESVVGAKGGLQIKSLQPNQTEVQDHPKQTARCSKPRPHHPCQVGRHWWTASKHLSLEMYKILNMLIRDKNRSVR